MREPAYPAARTVAPVVEAFFADCRRAARSRSPQELAPSPDAESVQAIIDVSFWASLRREEGHAPKISLAFLPPEHAAQPLLLEQRLPLTPAALTKLAPAVERPGIHLGVWGDGGGMYVWGATRAVPALCFVLEVVEPGLLVLKYRRSQGGKYGNVAVLQGDRIRVLDQAHAAGAGRPLAASLLGIDSPGEAANVLVQLAVSMRAHGRGGSLLVVPDATQSWRDSILWPVLYSVGPPLSELARLLRLDARERRQGKWQQEVHRSVEMIAGLTAVDGATVITDRYDLLAFGAKIGRLEGSAPVERVAVAEPIVGEAPRVVHPTQIGGTRHLSAAQFVHDQHDALALVASQDGRFTVFSWSPAEAMVQAHRIEAMLL